jgi:gamma-glutamyltranspeptidase/glutathione hydrolase
MMRLALLLPLLLWPQDKLASKRAAGPAGVVVAEHGEGTAAGVAILEQGGNAVDAAVATALAMGVALPSHSGLGGRSQLLIVMKDGAALHVDGGAQVPKLGGPDQSGGLKAACTPGSVAALAMALKEKGTMTWAEVIQPAIDLAKKKELAELLATYETLRDDGPEAFYTGKIADAIDADMAARGGLVRKEDLSAYKALKHEPLKSTYRGLGVVTADRPGSGLVVLEALNVLETFDFGKLDGEADRDHVLIEALRIAFEDRQIKWKEEKDRVETLSSKDHAKKRAAAIDLKKAGTPKIDPDHGGDTTHITVVDREGNACAFTQTLGPWFGCGKAKGLGFFYNATQGHNGSLAAGGRHTTGLSPTILTRDGKPYLVLGSAGELRIMSAVVCTIHRVIDRGQPLSEAVFAPRFHWEGPNLARETRVAVKELELPAAVVKELESRGFSAYAQRSDPYFGRVQAAVWDSEKKEWCAAADPRNTTSSARAADPAKVPVKK